MTDEAADLLRRYVASGEVIRDRKEAIERARASYHDAVAESERLRALLAEIMTREGVDTLVLEGIAVHYDGTVSKAIVLDRDRDS
jgi:hypothetical protein